MANNFFLIQAIRENLKKAGLENDPGFQQALRAAQTDPERLAKLERLAYANAYENENPLNPDPYLRPHTDLAGEVTVG